SILPRSTSPASPASRFSVTTWRIFFVATAATLWPAVTGGSNLLSCVLRHWYTAGMPIVHFCPRADWEAALRAGVYAPESLRTEGFIHFSAPEQVHLPANAIARGRTDLVLLEVDEGRLAE